MPIGASREYAARSRRRSRSHACPGFSNWHAWGTEGAHARGDLITLVLSHFDHLGPIIPKTTVRLTYCRSNNACGPIGPSTVLIRFTVRTHARVHGGRGFALFLINRSSWEDKHGNVDPRRHRGDRRPE